MIKSHLDPRTPLAWLPILLVWAVGCQVVSSSPTPTETSTPITPVTVPAEDATPTQLPPTDQPPTKTPEASDVNKPTAADADVLYVRAVQASDETWTFHVTVFHPDTGWEDYADGWDVVLPDGTVVKPDPDVDFTRPLLHPHEQEQPFIRSQSNILIPEGVTEVRVRAHDLVDGFGGRETGVDLTARSGSDFSVERSSNPP